MSTEPKDEKNLNQETIPISNFKNNGDFNEGVKIEVNKVLQKEKMDHVHFLDIPPPDENGNVTIKMKFPQSF